MSKFLAVVAVASLVAICSGPAFAAGGHGGGGHFGGGHFGGGHFGGGGFGGPGIGFGIGPGYYGYGYGYDDGCWQLQRVWTGRRWQVQQVRVC
jgi:hypothetical protein